MQALNTKELYATNCNAEEGWNGIILIIILLAADVKWLFDVFISLFILFHVYLFICCWHSVFILFGGNTSQSMSAG